MGEKQKKSIFFQFLKTFSLLLDIFLNPQLILLQAPVIIDETCYTKIQNHFLKFFLLMFSFKKMVIIIVFYQQREVFNCTRSPIKILAFIALHCM